ncbi:transcription initiation factor IIA gamma subunit, partial [Mycena sp. CBHHK59/15]
MASVYYEFFRAAPIGMALTDSLDELIRSGEISGELARAVLRQFDESLADAIVKQVKAKASVKGHLKTYNLCEDVVWTFILEDAVFRMEGNEIAKSKRVKIVAVKNGSLI